MTRTRKGGRKRHFRYRKYIEAVIIDTDKIRFIVHDLRGFRLMKVMSELWKALRGEPYVLKVEEPRSAWLALNQLIVVLKPNTPYDKREELIDKYSTSSRYELF